MERNGFNRAYRKLKRRFQEQARKEGSIYLPSVAPTGRADHIFIAMEPSIGRWGRTPEEARRAVDGGLRNFTYSLEDFLLHFSIRTYLCRPGESYYITDISKGAMPVSKARRNAKKRYGDWYPLLLEELSLTRKSDSLVFAVGRTVEAFLRRQRLPDLTDTLIHYSSQAGNARNRCITGKESEFGRFAESITFEDVLKVAGSVLADGDIPGHVGRETMKRLQRSKQKLTHSRRKLVFCYKTVFETARGPA